MVLYQVFMNFQVIKYLEMLCSKAFILFLVVMIFEFLVKSVLLKQALQDQDLFFKKLVGKKLFLLIVTIIKFANLINTLRKK